MINCNFSWLIWPNIRQPICYIHLTLWHFYMFLFQFSLWYFPLPNQFHPVFWDWCFIRLDLDEQSCQTGRKTKVLVSRPLISTDHDCYGTSNICNKIMIFGARKHMCCPVWRFFSPHPHIHIFSYERLFIDKGGGSSLMDKTQTNI